MANSPPGDHPPGAVGEQAEAYLSGCYRQYLEANHEGVPPWAWINQIAHGTRLDLEGRASASDDPVGPERLMTSVALQLIRLSDEQLRRVQHQRLVPLERALRHGDGSPPQSEAELAEAMIAGLRSLPPDGR